MHFFEYPFKSGSTEILQLPATTVTPGFYGDYSTFFPSPLKYDPTASSPTYYPTQAANIGWGASYANIEHFADPRQFYPGSIGPVKFYYPNKGPFESGIAANDKNTGYTELDSGVIFSLWDQWTTVYNNFNTEK